MSSLKESEIYEVVRSKYASAAEEAQDGDCCCGTDAKLSKDDYSEDELAFLPQQAAKASLGCANPTALAELERGEVVLDLGSGGGIDVLLSARRVGPTGMAYGLDMTDEMIELAEKNRLEAGVENARFLKGKMEELPLAENSVDVIISNCVVNLSPDKERVMSEAYRVLRPSGRLAIADIATLGDVPDGLRKSVELWAGCVAGALSKDAYIGILEATGFEAISLEVVRSYGRSDLEAVASSEEIKAALARLSEEEIKMAEGKLASVFVRARKPGAMTGKRCQEPFFEKKGS